MTHLLDRHEREVDLEEVHIIKHSPYYSETKFTQLIQSKPGLCILDLNIQNIYTKFDEFELFVNRVNSGNTISAICLNECWLNENSDLSGIQLPNYNMFYKLGNRVGHNHCGLVIYIHEQFNCKEVMLENDNTAWDYLCVELSHQSPNSKKYIISNTYRLPTDTIDDVQIFTNEFSAFLTTVKHRNQNAYICGDFNINLLSINTKKHAAEYFDRAVSIGFFPKITLPTRLQGASHTLIDNIWSSNMDENPLSKSGILINDISDHKMIFTYIEKTAYVEKFKKFIETEKRDEISIQNFTDKLKNVHIYHQLLEMNEANLEEKYEKLAAILKCAKDKHMPKQIVKYNKKKHKKSKWMT